MEWLRYQTVISLETQVDIKSQEKMSEYGSMAIPVVGSGA
jgi:hypothetical protein